MPRTSPRRAVLGAGAGMVAAAAAARIATLPSATAAAAPSGGVPAPASSGIDHIVVLMMENRSFDHYLGWLPGRERTPGRA